MFRVSGLRSVRVLGFQHGYGFLKTRYMNSKALLAGDLRP